MQTNLLRARNAAAWLLTLMGVLSGASARGATINWDNGAGTLNWSAANNWNPNGVPAANNQIQFNGVGAGSAQVPANATVTMSGVGSYTANPSTTEVDLNNGAGFILDIGASNNYTYWPTIKVQDAFAYTFLSGAAGRLAIRTTTTVDVVSGGALTVDNGFTVSGLGTGTLTKTGAGALTIANNYNGSGGTIHLNIQGGTLAVVADSASSNITGNITLSGGALNLQANNSNNVRITTTVTGAAGTTINVLANSTAGAGVVRNDALTANWSANLASLDIASGGTFDLRGNQTRVDALTGGATASIINSYYQNNSGIVGNTLTVGANNGSGTYNGAFTSSTSTTLTVPGLVSLTKIGTGTQELSGTGIAYGGPTTVSNGTLKLTDATNFNSTVAVASGASLDLSRTTGSWNFANSISGAGAVAKTGAGTLTLAVAHSYTGLTTVSAGTLSYGVSDAISTGGVTVNGATAVLSLGAFSDSVGAVTLSGGGQINGSTGVLTSTGGFTMNSGSASAILAGGVALTKATSGTVTLSGANSYTGTTTISAGTLQIGDGTNNTARAGTGTLAVGANTLLLNLSSAATLNNSSVTLASGGLIQNNGVGKVTLNNNSGASFNTGTVHGGTGGIVLANTLTGGVALGVGGDVTLNAAGSNYVVRATSPGATVRVTSSGAFWWIGTETLANAPNLDISSGVTVSNNTSQAAGSLYYNNLTGAGSFTYNGNATGYILGTSTLGGTITANNRNLSFGNGGATGAAGATTIVNTAGVAFNSTTNNTYSGAMSGAGTVTKQAANTLTFSGVNSYTGATTISAGKLTLADGAGKLYQTGAFFGTAGTSYVNVNTGGTFTTWDWNYGDAFALSQLRSNYYSVNLNGGTIQIDDTFSSVRAFQVGASGGTLEVTAGNTYTKVAGTTGLESVIRFTANSTLTLGGAGIGTIADSLAPASYGSTGFAITKAGSGTWTLSGANAYTGATTVNDGTLLINGSLTGAGGAVTVASGGTLGGSGVISRAVNINAGGTLSPGNSPDQIFTGALTLAPLSIYEIEIFGPGVGNGVTGYDQTVVTGAVSLNGALLNLLTISGVTVGDFFTIIDNDGSDAVTGTFAGLAEGAEFVKGGYYFSISYLGGVNNNDVVLTITAIVPEPASLTLCGLALLVSGGVAWRKRQRRGA